MEIRNINNLEKKKIQFRQTDFKTESVVKAKTSMRFGESESNLEIQSKKEVLKELVKNELEGNKNKQNQKQITEKQTQEKKSLTQKDTITEEQVISKLKTNSILVNKQTKPYTENLHKNHRKNLKNQFLENSLSYFTDVQKLELLLFYAIPQKDTNPIAHRLINAFGTIKDVFKADYNKLIEINGIKENSALLIKLVSSFYPVINSPEEIKQINSAGVAKDFCTKLFLGVNIEQFYVICLAKNNQIKKFKMLHSGSADEIVVQIRNITEFTLSEKCNRIIISHNHPTGRGIMSDEDCSFTYSLICSCLLNSIEVIDHIIVGTDKTISLASQNILQKLKETAFNSLNIPRDKRLLISNRSKEYILDNE